MLLTTVLFSQNSGYSLSFDGVDDYVEIPASSDYDFSDEDAFSLSFWVNFSDVSSEQYIFSAEDMFWVYLDGTGEIKFRYRNHPSGNWPEFNSSFSPEVGVWYHIAITTDNGASKIYVSGLLDEESNVSISGLTANGNNSRNLELGARKVYSGNPTKFLHGNLDDVAMWNEAITASEVFSIYDQGVIVDLSSNASNYNSSSNLVCYWRFNEGQGSATTDLSANNNGSVIGASWSTSTSLVAFKPQTKAELQTAVDLWVSDNASALSTYGEINTWDVSLITDMRGLIRETTFNDDISS
ncbi:MAG: hypothetical protein CMG41_03550, partial [Candidatus Marinimicrobia bacterium]|nr:hypothetical protein [Candidatus Neomarinimicrobiota bacterium]